MGVESLYPIQPSNDIVAIQKKYGDRVVINGGFDSQGPAGRDDASEETIREEARRMANTYAVNGGYICLPLIGNGQFVTPEQGIRMGWESDRLSRRKRQRIRRFSGSLRFN